MNVVSYVLQIVSHLTEFSSQSISEVYIQVYTGPSKLWQHFSWWMLKKSIHEARYKIM